SAMVSWPAADHSVRSSQAVGSRGERSTAPPWCSCESRLPRALILPRFPPRPTGLAPVLWFRFSRLALSSYALQHGPRRSSFELCPSATTVALSCYAIALSSYAASPPALPHSSWSYVSAPRDRIAPRQAALESPDF